MNPTQKRIFIVLLSIGILYFCVFIFPNNTGAKDQMMISLFEPDEFAQSPIIIKMLTPRSSFEQTVLNFVAYGHYYYGSPFYFFSAFTLLPLRFSEAWRNVQLGLLLLRQIVSVLPMIAALFLLVFVQTKFLSYIKSIGLFILLLSVSAVVENSMWWHVDSLAFLFIALTFYYLDKDDQRFGRDFLLAAVAVGLATGTKVIGLFFFLAIPTYLLFGIIHKRITWYTACLRGASFMGVMAATILISNPFLLVPGEFGLMARILSRQSAAMSQGWTLAYAKGPASWLPIIQNLYGQLIFIALVLFALGLGIWRGTNRILHMLIAAWAVPFGLYILFTIAIKPTHFFLPVLLPVFSSIVVLFDPSLYQSNLPRKFLPWLARGIVLTILAYQFTVYVNKDVAMYREVLFRERTEKSLVFYNTLKNEYLPRVRSNDKLVIFRDVRMYFPESQKWIIRSYWNSSYTTIEEIQPDMIILWSQRILDYTREGAQENAVDPAAFEDTYQFYVDADRDRLQGYRLVYRDAEGLFFVSEAIYETFYNQ